VTLVDLHIVTADSFGTAESELAGIVTPYKLRTGRHDIEKADYVSQFDLQQVAAFGNGNNDRLMLKAVKEGGGLAIAVDNGEGCAMDAMRNADLFVVGAANAIDLLLDPVAPEGHAAVLSSQRSAGTTVPSGVPLRVALEHRVAIKRAGEPIQGRLVDPIYVYDRQVLPAGTLVEGHIAKIGGVPIGRRLIALLYGNLDTAAGSSRAV
jgi:soluble P-type ATPase